MAMARPRTQSQTQTQTENPACFVSVLLVCLYVIWFKFNLSHLLSISRHVLPPKHTYSSTPSTVCHTNKHTQLHAVQFVFNYTYDICFRCLPFMFVGPMHVCVCVCLLEGIMGRIRNILCISFKAIHPSFFPPHVLSGLFMVFDSYV